MMAEKDRKTSPWLHKLPPAKTGTRKRGGPGVVRYYAEAEACRERPGVWLLLARQMRNCYMCADKVRDGRFAAFRPKGHWKVAVRESHGQKVEGLSCTVWTGDVYVCYDPPPLSAAELFDAETEFPAEGTDPWELIVNQKKPNNK